MTNDLLPYSTSEMHDSIDFVTINSLDKFFESLYILPFGLYQDLQLFL